MFHYGTDRFCRRASEAGISGLILPDVPYEESAEFRETCERYGMDLVSMVAPTSKDRVAAISRQVVHTPPQPRARSRLHHTLWIAAFVTLAAAVAYIRAIYKDIREAVAPMA